jgi:hypothetical protein
MPKNKTYAVLSLALALSSSIWIIGGPHIPELYRHAAGLLISSANLGDFIYPWYGSRELIINHRDPYRRDVTSEIRHSVGVEQHGITDPDWGQFIYPVYVGFLLFPMVWMPFHIAQLVFFVVLFVSVVISVSLWVRFVDLRLSFAGTLLLITFSLVSPPFVHGLMLRQVGVLVAMLVSVVAVFLLRGKFFFAGFVLALATVKPQMILLLLAWLLIWACFDWKNRSGLIYAFAATSALLILAAELLLPGWVNEWIGAIHSARRYGSSSILQVLLGHRLGILASIAFAGFISFVLLKLQKTATSEDFAVGFSLVLLLQLIVLPLTAGFNHVLTFPAVLLLIKHFLLKQTAGDQVTPAAVTASVVR